MNSLRRSSEIETSISAEPLVSVVIPCYRQAEYLPAAIDSCLGQSHRNLEIIVVNDESDDDTEKVALSYADPIRYVRRRNGGVSAARNTGIDLAKGVYIKFLDADDWLLPDQIAQQVDALEGRLDRIAVGTVRAYQDQDPTQFTDLSPSFGALLPDLFRLPDSAIHGFLIPLRLVRVIGGFDESIGNAEDWDFLTRLGMLRPQVVCDSRLGAYYRLRDSSRREDKLEVVSGAAVALIRRHHELRQQEFREWFGAELLHAQQSIYRRRLLLGTGDDALQAELLKCIRELHQHVGQLSRGWKFDMLRRIFGYRGAEHLYARIVRLMSGANDEKVKIE